MRDVSLGQLTVGVARLPERNLDVLRAVAVLCVFIDHTTEPFVAAVVRPFTTQPLGSFGVVLFFVHTSTVLMASLARLERGGRSGWSLASAFYARRACRIYPLAMVAVVLAVWLGLPFGTTGTLTPAPHPIGVVLANLALVQNLARLPNVIGVLWSLPPEVQMYVLLPGFYALATAGGRAARMFGAVPLTAILVALVVRSGEIPGAERLSVLSLGPCFVSGVIAYWLCVRTSPTFPAWTWGGALAVVAIVFFACRPDGYHVERWWPAALLLGILLPRVRELGPGVVTQACATVAKYSYGVYLTHSMIGGWILQRWPKAAPLPFVAIVIVGTALASYAAYHLIEAPMIRLGAGRWRSSPTLAATAPVP